MDTSWDSHCNFSLVKSRMRISFYLIEKSLILRSLGSFLFGCQIVQLVNHSVGFKTNGTIDWWKELDSAFCHFFNFFPSIMSVNFETNDHDSQTELFIWHLKGREFGFNLRGRILHSSYNYIFLSSHIPAGIFDCVT